MRLACVEHLVALIGRGGAAVTPESELPEDEPPAPGVAAEVAEAIVLPPAGPVHPDARSRDPHPVLPDDIGSLEQLLLDLVAAERIGARLPQLTTHAPLMEAARRHTLDMGLRPELFHSDLHEHYRIRCPRCRVAENVGRCPAGEGLYLGNAEPRCGIEVIHRAWMASAEHRANILEPGLRLIGVSAVQGVDLRFYATLALLG